jgi:hypothetical protein
MFLVPIRVIVNIVSVYKLVCFVGLFVCLFRGVCVYVCLRAYCIAASSLDLEVV